MDEIMFEERIEELIQAKNKFGKYLRDELEELKKDATHEEELFERICAFMDVLIEFESCFAGLDD